MRRRSESWEPEEELLACDVVFGGANEKVQHGSEPDHVGALDDVVGAAIDPEVDIGDSTERVVFGETGESGDVETEFFGVLRGFDHVGRFAAADDEDHDIAFVGVKIQSFGHPVFVTAIVAECGDEVCIVKSERTDFALLGKVGGEMAGDRCARSISGQQQLSPCIARFGNAILETRDEPGNLGVSEKSWIFGEVGLEVHGFRGCRRERLLRCQSALLSVFPDSSLAHDAKRTGEVRARWYGRGKRRQAVDDISTGRLLR
jgi:hypothetical protein